MITLNNINLSSINLSGIDLGGIKLGLGGRGSSGDGFPVLPGDVTRWHFGGLTNEMMAAMDDPRIEDADGKGRFLSFKNFLWAGMSGVNGYMQNFNQYFVGCDESNKTVSDSSMKLVLLESDSQKVIYDRYSHQIGYTYNFYIKVTGIEGRMLNVDAGTLGGRIMSITEDGIYSINATISDNWGNNMLYLIFPPSSSNNTVTIEQLPLYPGALVFDGVDDYGICENFPILTKEKGYTVVALRQFLGSRDSFLISNRVTGTAFSNGAFIFERFWEKSGAIFYNFGTPSDQLSLKPYSPFSYLTSKSYNGRATNAGDAVPSNTLLVGKSIINDSNSTNAAIWEICILDHDATEEELQKIQDYYKQEYPWLFPDQAWTVTGKTNEDTDRATIANITGNGNNLQLKNFAFSGSSGYGLYDIPSPTTWPYYGVTKVNLTKYSIQLTNRSHTNQDLLIFFEHGSSLLVAGTYNFTRFRFKITNPNNHPLSAFFRGDKSLWNIDVTESGIYEFPGITLTLEEDANTNYGFELATANEIENFSVIFELLPKYAGYLVTDGVDDKIISSDFVMDKEFTIVGEWKLVSDEMESAGIVKPSSLFVFNKDNGLIIYINNTSKGQVLNTKTLKAICSDGRVYSDDWSEMLVSEEQPIASSKSSLLIGINGNNFAKIALKNLAIYNQILSKDDCIKAYNYLQTLKAK